MCHLCDSAKILTCSGLHFRHPGNKQYVPQRVTEGARERLHRKNSAQWLAQVSHKCELIHQRKMWLGPCAYLMLNPGDAGHNRCLVKSLKDGEDTVFGSNSKVLACPEGRLKWISGLRPRISDCSGPVLLDAVQSQTKARRSVPRTLPSPQGLKPSSGIIGSLFLTPNPIHQATLPTVNYVQVHPFSPMVQPYHRGLHLGDTSPLVSWLLSSSPLSLVHQLPKACIRSSLSPAQKPPATSFSIKCRKFYS